MMKQVTEPLTVILNILELLYSGTCVLFYDVPRAMKRERDCGIQRGSRMRPPEK